MFLDKYKELSAYELLLMAENVQEKYEAYARECEERGNWPEALMVRMGSQRAQEQLRAEFLMKKWKELNSDAESVSQKRS